MSDLHQHGQDWIPVWHNEPDEVIGFFFLNDLTLVHPHPNVSGFDCFLCTHFHDRLQEHILVSEFMKTFGHPVRFVMSDAPVEDVMKIFQQETQLVLIHDASQADKVRLPLAYRRFNMRIELLCSLYRKPICMDL